eukprot:876023_1
MKKNSFFKPHYDAGYSWNENKKCSMTIIFYLNDDFEGGETIFHVNQKHVSVKPEIGKVLIFVQRGFFNPLHEGAPHVSNGKYKYIIRSDLVYEKVLNDNVCCSPAVDDDNSFSFKNCILL